MSFIESSTQTDIQADIRIEFAHFHALFQQTLKEERIADLVKQAVALNKAIVAEVQEALYDVSHCDRFELVVKRVRSKFHIPSLMMGIDLTVFALNQIANQGDVWSERALWILSDREKRSGRVLQDPTV